MIPLTVMGYIRRSARSESSENTGLIHGSGVCGVVFDLEAGTESISVHVFRVTRRVIYLGTAERFWVSAIGICNDEGVLGEGTQDSAGIVDEFEDLVAGVDDGHGNLQVPQSVDLDIGGRGLDSQAGSSTGGDSRNDEDGEDGVEEREHCNMGSQGDWRANCVKTEALRPVKSGPAKASDPGALMGQYNPSQLSASDSHRKDVGCICEVIKCLSGLGAVSLWPPISAFLEHA